MYRVLFLREFLFAPLKADAAPDIFPPLESGLMAYLRPSALTFPPPGPRKRLPLRCLMALGSLYPGPFLVPRRPTDGLCTVPPVRASWQEA